MAEIRAKKHRLPPTAYRGRKNVAITANIEGRAPLFLDSDVVSAMIPILQEEVDKFSCNVGIYCFMPDHLHLILCGMTDQADAKAAFEAFKKQTGVWLGTHREGFCWQDGYYDHIIRKSDDWRRQVRYVYLNPVRKGMVSDASHWPHTGSLGFNLEELLIDSNY